MNISTTIQLVSQLAFYVIILGCQESNTDIYSNPNWSHYQGGPEVNQYKSFDQINKGNIDQLEVAWIYDAGDIDTLNRSQIQCNPLIIDGVLYGSSLKLKLFALDAATGKNLWTYDPQEYRKDKTGAGVNRGFAYWSKGEDKRLFFGVGSELHVVNATTGKPIVSFGEGGLLDLKKGLGRDLENKYYALNSPGIVYKDLIIIGGRLDEGADHAPGHIRAFSVLTGEMKWIFHTIPHPGEFGYDTWPEDGYLKSGGANTWAGFSLDMEEGIVYAPTGSASFDFYGGDRHGQNLFANSIIALKAETGERIWHFQVRHHDVWDRDLPAPPNLVTVEKDGVRIKALAQISKSGELFVLNRLTGEPIYPIEEVPAPASLLHGEETWPTQPVPTVYPPFSRKTITENDLAIRSKEARDFALDAYSNHPTGEFLPPSEQGNILFSGMDGGGEWGGAAYDPNQSIMFVNSNEMTWQMKMNKYEPQSPGECLYQSGCVSCHGRDMQGGEMFGTIPSLIGVKNRKSDTEIRTSIRNGKGVMPPFASLSDEEIEDLIRFIKNEEPLVRKPSLRGGKEWPYAYYFDGYKKYLAPDGLPIIRPPWGQLTAVDMDNAKIKWQVPLGDIDSLDIPGYPITGTENYGGPVVTDDLIFIGASADGRFRVFDKETGEELWRYELPAPGFATPATYMVDGKQYVVIACGGGKIGTKSGDSWVAFSLGDSIP
ncbi:MAG: c-type cytochrome [Bacteroidetes bacterium]|nr:c-type cytochrome [Bacteroidota bacterium]MDA1121226.1 c-type cytochrome [Bacteroidota bacterium]